ncbi:MAG: CHAT domain-containing protein, partial [Myxococcota bacterium]
SLKEVALIVSDAIAALSTPTERADAPVVASVELPDLPKGTVAIEYVLGEHSGYAWVVRDGLVDVRRVAGERELAPLIIALLPMLVDPWHAPDEAKAHRALARKLYDALLAPLEDLLRHADHVIVAPDGPLYHVPFEVFVRPSEGDTPHYVILDHAISYTPSIDVLAYLGRARPSTAAPALKKRALLLGAPTLTQKGVELMTLSGGAVRKGSWDFGAFFAPLPGTKRELRRIHSALARAHDWAPTVHTGARATEAALRDGALAEYDLVHIATHGLSDAPSWSPFAADISLMQPALLLSADEDGAHDGVLSLDEVLGMRTRAELVVLSGCTTGRGWSALGDSAFGLAGALLHAGARRVIATTWTISDVGTVALMGAFYAHYLKEGDAAQALRSAQRETLFTKRYASPFYWAAFRVIGAPALDGTLRR